jgi:hypothetical protein
MFNHVLPIAAFGVVAFVLVFVHPAAQASRQTTPQKAAQQAAAGSRIATANVAAAVVGPRLAASK